MSCKNVKYMWVLLGAVREPILGYFHHNSRSGNNITIKVSLTCLLYYCVDNAVPTHSYFQAITYTSLYKVSYKYINSFQQFLVHILTVIK